ARTSPFPIILRYNAAYPLVVDRNFADNPAIQRIPLDDGGGFTAIPKRGQGIHQPVDDDRFSSVLRWAASNDLYATIYLYPDSHGVFADLRESLARAKLSYGLEFIPPGRELNFASEGESPPEL
ncbi:MAG: hypothetical protein ACO3RV_04160, partial [Luteolibacter sp.]